MEDRQQWLSLAAVVLVILGLGFFLYRQSRQEGEAEVTEASEVDNAAGDELANTMNVDIPENAERANLSGDGGNGVATRTYEEGEFMSSVLAGLPDPENGAFYEAYLVEGEGSDESVMLLGKLRSAKGGWMIDYTDEEDLSNYDMVRVTREMTDDGQPEETVLQGSF